jgi:hypothetical protein
MTKTKECRIINVVEDKCYLQIQNGDDVFQFAVKEDEIEMIEKACKDYKRNTSKQHWYTKAIQDLKKEQEQIEKRKQRYKTLTIMELTEINANHCRLCGTQRCRGIFDQEYGNTCSAIDEYITE